MKSNPNHISKALTPAILLAAATSLLLSTASVRSDPPCTGPGGASSTGYYIQYAVSSAYLSKCAHDELAHLDPPRVHKYHNKIVTENFSYHYANSTTSTSYVTETIDCGTSSGIRYVEPGTVSATYDEDRTITYTDLEPGRYCNSGATNYYVGTWSVTYDSDDGRKMSGNACGGNPFCYTEYSEHGTKSLAATLTNQAWTWIGTNDTLNFTIYCNPPNQTNTTHSGDGGAVTIN